MQINVLDYWWEGCNRQQKYPGTIVKYNTSIGKRMLQLNDQDYHKKYPMRWDAVHQFAKDDHYTLFPAFPRTLPLSAEFYDITNGIEQIT